MSIDKTNKQQLQAYELIETTNSSFFLTGKAGTGKTTFLQTVQKEIDKNKLFLRKKFIKKTFGKIIKKLKRKFNKKTYFLNGYKYNTHIYAAYKRLTSKLKKQTK